MNRACVYFGCRVVTYQADDYYGQECPACGHVGEEIEPEGRES